MPFTLYHMGPGLAIKSLLQGGFSLMVFGWAQIVIDIQPLVAILSGEGQLHGFSHTYVGATLLGAIAAVTGKHLSEWGLIMLGVARRGAIRIGWRITFVSAFIGTYTHVLIDSVMHADMAPFYPLSAANALLGTLSYGDLHRFCIYSGLAGAALYFLVQLLVAMRAGKFPS